MVIDWKDVSFLNLQVEVFKKITFIVRLIASVFLLARYFFDEDDRNETLLLLMGISIVIFVPQILKLLGQIAFPNELDPDWIQDNTGFDSNSSLMITMLFPLIHQAVEGVVIMMIIVKTMTVSISKNYHSLTSAAAWTFGWVITPALYATAVIILAGLTNLEGFLGDLIDIATPQNATYKTLTIASWIIGYLVIPTGINIGTSKTKKSKQKVKIDLDGLVGGLTGYFAGRANDTEDPSSYTPKSPKPLDGNDGSGEYTKNGNPRSGPSGPGPVSYTSDKTENYQLPAKTLSTLQEEEKAETKKTVENNLQNIQQDEAYTKTASNQEGFSKNSSQLHTDNFISTENDQAKSPPTAMSDQEFETKFNPGNAENDQAKSPPTTMSDQEFETKFNFQKIESTPPSEKTSRKATERPHVNPPVQPKSSHIANSIKDAAVITSIVATAAGHPEIGTVARAITLGVDIIEKTTVKSAIPETISDADFTAKFSHERNQT